MEPEEWRNELLAVEYQLKDLASAFNLTGNLLLHEHLTQLAERINTASKNANAEVFAQFEDK